MARYKILTMYGYVSSMSHHDAKVTTNHLHLYAFCLALLACSGLQAAELFVDVSATCRTPDGTKQAPFQSINAAVKKARHGDTIVVAGGTYREGIVIRRRKGEGILALKAAPGQRPVLSGRQLVKNWEQVSEGLYRTTLGFLPRNLFLDEVYMPLARFPEDGWLTVTPKRNGALEVPLKEKLPAGCLCYVWLARGNVFGKALVKGSSQPGTFVLEDHKMKLATTPEKPDRCFFLGHPDFIRKHGQWSWQKKGSKTYEILLRLDKSPEQFQIEIGGACTPLTISQSENISLAGFDITGGSPFGVHINGSEKVHADSLGMYWNSKSFYARGCREVHLRNSRISCNQDAVSFLDAQDISVRTCDVGYNFEDGIRVSWKSKNVLLEGNRVHHHFWWGHPDNIQFFRDVKNVTLRNNLIFASCQGVMAQELDGCLLENNTCLGTAAYMLIWGHGSSNDIVMKRNTLLFSAYGAVSITGKGNRLHHNVIMGLRFSKGPLTDRDFHASTNLYLSKGGRWQVYCDNRWFRSLEALAKVTGETESTFQPLPVPGLPLGVGVIHEKTIADCTRNTLLIRGDTQFKVGNYAEVNFDGVPRQITAVCRDSITFQPPLYARPLSGYLILNWGDQKELKWKPHFGENYGATISLDDVRLDRYTSVPMPKQVQAFIDRFDLLIPPHGF